MNDPATSPGRGEIGNFVMRAIEVIVAATRLMNVPRFVLAIA
jgi:hypothetical protein